ncbi:polysaccharide biosynthesis/export family protein [Roseateles sp. BYS180W]|uniref:Polysaccharide biosynthesis/export family protein n=1 Tax=Roseateles rivi TaxID=3299028 RepID=A0ABW7FZH9_9BURK
MVFGAHLFQGHFAKESFAGFNPMHQITPGDRLTVRLWGAFTHDGVVTVDAQGNVFLPQVGPVRVAGVRNGELNAHVEAQVKRTFRANVGVYASLEAAQPVRIYVTGYVRAPGLYGGVSSDSVLAYLDKAGGIDPERGSFLNLDVMRGGQTRAQINLYDFLLHGQMPALQLQDGDTLVVKPRQHSVQVSGAAFNAYTFEFSKATLSAAELIAVARPRPEATHMAIVRKTGSQRRSEYHALSSVGQSPKVEIQDGDEVTFSADKYPGTVLVRIEGAHLGERTLVMPYGSTLADAIKRIRPAPQAQMQAMQLMRRSVAVRQKELLETSLRSMEAYALTARSSTSEESALRVREAELITQYIARARSVQPTGQVVLAQSEASGAMLLEDGDVLRVPERTHLVTISGEVNMPSALVHEPGMNASAYIARAGGHTQSSDGARILVLRQDGSVSENPRGALQPGDEVLVLPRIDTKNIEVARGLTQIIYQVAVAARALLAL